MKRLDELVASVTFGTKTEAEAEIAFYQRLGELVRVPTQVQLAGAPVTLLGFEALGRAGRFRAQVETPAGPLQIGLDALDLSAMGPQITSLVAGYRHWLGYAGVTLPQMPEVKAKKIVNPDLIEAKIEAMRATMASVVAELGQLDLEEIESWVGDDPADQNTKYWSDDAHRYVELVTELKAVQADIEEIITTGWRGAAAELTLELLDAFQACSFEYWHYDEVQFTVTDMLRSWLKHGAALGFTLLEPEPAVALLFEQIEAFDLRLWLNEIMVEVDPRARPALLSALHPRAIEGGPNLGYKCNPWADALTLVRLASGELDALLDELPLSHWSDQKMTQILKQLHTRGETQRAVQLADEWLGVMESYVDGWRVPSTSSVLQRRRAMLAQLGHRDEVLQSLLGLLRERPNLEHFTELVQLAGEDDALVKEALEVVASDADVLVQLAQRSPSTEVAERIAAYSIDALGAVSSLALKPAADALLTQHPEVAVRVYAALGWRHVNRGKSRYYHLAHDAFEIARDLYLSLGRTAEWVSVVDAVMRVHRQKSSFMPGFRRIASL